MLSVPFQLNGVLNVNVFQPVVDTDSVPESTSVIPEEKDEMLVADVDFIFIPNYSSSEYCLQQH